MKNCVVTGASSGIGEATVRLLRDQGYKVYMGARREDRLRKLSGETGAQGHVLDVTDPASVREFVRHLPEEIHVLVNNAGGALGLEPVCEMKENDWLGMYQSNVLGTARMIREMFPRLFRSGDGSHVVNVGSIAAIETYLGGAGYTGAKHALRALTETLRLEWLGLPIRVTQIDPGLVETEFSVVRFAGDAVRAAKVYEGMTPLVAGDVADAIVWALTRPPHVNIDQIVIRPRDQARADKVYRTATPD
jgi:NADP-dependent 3-hydroxy acid dehydrogenase YdfG